MRLFLFLTILVSALNTNAQMDASLLRFPDISGTQICFVYGGDIWLVNQEGGTANRLTSSIGEESYPRFSPDGKTIAYSAAYNGNTDVYTIPVTGGIPVRITYNSMPDRMVEWYPDGKHLLIASGREEGTGRANQFFKVDSKGGLPEKLPLPYGELASFSPDGNSIAYVTKITENYPFKRYKGGLASDIILYDLKANKSENITKNPMTDGKPAWIKNNIYYVSDAGTDTRRNIWTYDHSKKSAVQTTFFKEDDINYMTGGNNELVFEAGGKLYVLTAGATQYKEVPIKIISDAATLMPKTVNASRNIQYYDPSPDGKRAVFSARGDIFNLPSEDGPSLNLSNSSGSFERFPSWSPNGKQIAFWSDLSGENELYVQDATGTANRKKLTDYKKGLGWNLYWSPDSKKIAYIDIDQQISIVQVATGTIEKVDKTTTLTYGGLNGFSLSWSPDSKWITYSKTVANKNDAIFVYSLEQKKLQAATSGYYNDSRPVFDVTGKYIFFLTDRDFSPSYSNLDGSWIYANSTQIAVASLDPFTKQFFFPKNDEVKVTADTTATEKSAEKKPADTKTTPPKPAAAMLVNLDRFESRVEIISGIAGNYTDLAAVEGKLIYQKFPNTGAQPGASTLYFYDIAKREEKQIIAGINDFAITKDGKSIMVRDAQGFALISINPEQKITKRFPTSSMEMVVYPREEWKQIFNDTWRRYRDFFYDPNMQKVNWEAQRKHYGPMIDQAITRWDVNTILVNLISELSAGHTYANGGDLESGPARETGFLGIDWSLENGAYKIKKIIRPAAWDNEVRSPFDQSGSTVKEGDYILAVNGRTLDATIDPYAFFEGLNGKTVSLTVNSKGSSDGSREVLVKTLNPFEERRLRHLDWIEQNRKKVSDLSGGQLAYLYMPNTGAFGQTELLRQFYGQIDKKGFVIDERFNAGGQLADRFIEMLNRPDIYNLAWRNADVTNWPAKANSGPKVMLINGWAGSGGDAFPWAFQQLNLGPIIGERTLGILVGPATGHQLIDGGSITVPDARLYGNTGKWFAEGYGIVPDFEVWDDPAEMVKGNDPQLIKAVEEAMKQVKEKPRKLYPRPAFEDRTSEGLKAKQ